MRLCRPLLMGSVAGALALAVAAGAARAQDEDASCRNGLFPAENPQLGLGRVKGPGPLALADNVAGCAKGDAHCWSPGRLPAGAEVITGRVRGDRVCVYDPGAKGGAAGWAPRSRIAARPARADPPLSAWRGWWREHPDVILLDPRPDGQLTVSGRAYWFGPKSVHFGQLNAVAMPDGARTVAREDDNAESCTATLSLVGPYLVVADNMACGGANVSFTGVYRRFTPKGPRRPPR